MRIAEVGYYDIGDIWMMPINCSNWLKWIEEWEGE